ncbi:MAG: S-layer homology domain-containing protein [Clostridiales bacterium]|nr:S-layer homology domain-containing protein [Clostridiales bacterium]
MKKRILAWVLALVMIVGLLPTVAFAADLSGSGTKDDPYLIATADDLVTFRDKVNATKKGTSTLCGKLTANIDLSSLSGDWTPIGKYNSYSDYTYYGGTFDGAGHTISGLHIDNASTGYQGLFGYVKNGTIKNLTVDGSVKTSATSSAYAAGIVAYGSPVTMENCTNKVNVTGVKKGYVAGVVAYTYTGSSLTGCMNFGSITSEGKSGVYEYYVGGVVATATGTTIERCANFGAVTSALKRTAGIAGNYGGNGSITLCVNSGAITGAYEIGGIVGGVSGANTKIESCYNLGSVTCNTPSPKFSEKYAKGVGGIVGDPTSTSNTATVANCYNAGTITNNDSTTAGITVGGIVGSSAGKSYSGAVTPGLITATNCYYLSGTAATGDGANGSGTITAKTESELKAPDMPGLLGGSYVADANGGYPILGWQDPTAKYTVTFTLSPEDAALTVSQDGVPIDPVSVHTYELTNGDYDYKVTADEHDDAAGTFTVAYGGQTINVSLNIKLYTVKFEIDPDEGAELVVDGQTPEVTGGRTYRLPKSDSQYSYTIKAFGYQDATGTFTVTGNETADTQSVTLTALDTYPVSVGAITAADGAAIDPTVTVTCPVWQKTLTAEADGSYRLPNGSYHYTISCSGYKSVSGDFTVENGAASIPGAVLEVQTAWDGKTYTEPQKDENGVYQIGSPDELMWFNENGKTSDSVKLTADICINEDVTIEDTSKLHKWTPIGWYKDYNTSDKYKGTFDGDGHTISGLYILAKSTSADKRASYTGLIGYADEGSMICNLTISDSLIENRSTAANRGKSVGAVAGDAYNVENCHVTSSVTVYGISSYVGGVAGYVDGSITRSSSAATVTGEGTRIGGVVGCVQSKSSTAMTECFYTGKVKGASLVGGLVGDLYNGGTITDCYNTGSVTATSPSGAAGGLLGNFRYGTLKNSYSSTVPTAVKAGSILGRLEDPQQRTLEKVYGLSNEAVTETVGNLNGYAIQNGTATLKTEDELKALTSADLSDKFTADSENINRGYPILAWQNSGSGEPVDPDHPAIEPDGWDGKASAAEPKTDGGVYQIASAADLKWFADHAAATPAIRGVLTANIDLNNRDWTPVDGGFTGELDGADFAITNLYCKNERGSAALFAANGGKLKNLNVTGIVVGGDNSAILAASNTGTITSCTTHGTLKGGNCAAGITAVNSGTVETCVNNAAVTGDRYVGGIAASNTKGTITGCANSGIIRAKGMMAAGVAADNDGGTVTSCANNGAIVSTVSTLHGYVGGVVGRNNGTVKGAYNAGNVEALGGAVGGAVGLNLSKVVFENLYNVGDVTGGDYEDDGYPTNNKISSQDELDAMPQALAKAMKLLAEKTAIGGELTLTGKVEVNGKLTANYTGDANGLLYVWYYSYDDNDDAVVAITDAAEYTIPDTLTGRTLRVKALCADASGVLKADASGKVEGLEGVVSIRGAAVVGRTLTASFASSETDQGTLTYTWYRGAKQVDTGEAYTVTADDVGKTLTVKVTSGTKPGVKQATTQEIKTADAAGLWELADCDEPVNVSGVYQITTEKELHWFASEVNGGNGSISAKLLNDIALTTANWYPIGKSGHPFTGTFDGNGKRITGLKVSRAEDEVGFFGLIGKSGLIGKGGLVKDLSVSGTVAATGDVSQTGGIAGAMADAGGGEARNARITDCFFTGSVSGNIQVGGIVGCVGLNNVVERCGNDAAVTGAQQVGGIAGANSYGVVRYSRNKGSVGGTDAKSVGGVIGEVQNYAEVLGCYNTGSVTGKDYLGGVAGNVYVASAPLGCYNVGTVDAAVHCGGAFGSFGGDDYIPIKQGSFYKAPLLAAFQPNGARARTAAEMKAASFVTALNSEAYVTCYERDGVSAQLNDGYPILTWEANGSYLITLDPNGGYCDTADVRTTSTGALGTLPADGYRWNYRFDGWFTAKDGGSAVTADTVFTEATTIYAHWTRTRETTVGRTKTVYFSLSRDGEYLTGNDADQTMLAAVPVKITWFDLADYGLEEFSVKSNGKVVEQPTMLHLLIRMVEQYKLNGGKAANGTDALTVSGTFGSMTLAKFWDVKSNLTYFLNHTYPLMKPGIGATADYMTLENGDFVEVGLYSKQDYWTSSAAGYAYLAKPDGTAVDRLGLTAREAQTLVLHRAGADMRNGTPQDATLKNTKVYVTSDLSEADTDVTRWTELGTTNGSAELAVSFRKPGTYYVAAAGSSVSGPGVCVITVTGDAVSDVEATIDQLPDTGDITTADAAQIEAARAAYDALTDAEQSQVNNLDRLTEAEATLAARRTEELIDAIGDVTKNSGSAISDARRAYEALDDAHKEQVKNRDKLFDAIEAYDTIRSSTGTVAKPSVNDAAKDSAADDNGLPFTDVPAGSWYYGGVEYAYENGLMTGTSRTMFSPSTDTTRGMIVTILARLEGENTSGTPWYAAGQTWAMANGVSDGTGMERSITREQLAAMLHRYAKLCGYDVTAEPASIQTFADYDSVSAYAREAMAWCVESGLIQGSSGRLAPQENASRAQVAAILTRYAQKIAK